jgi:hypothetical protein
VLLDPEAKLSGLYISQKPWSGWGSHLPLQYHNLLGPEEVLAMLRRRQRRIAAGLCHSVWHIGIVVEYHESRGRRTLLEVSDCEPLENSSTVLLSSRVGQIVGWEQLEVEQMEID